MKYSVYQHCFYFLFGFSQENIKYQKPPSDFEKLLLATFNQESKIMRHLDGNYAAECSANS